MSKLFARMTQHNQLSTINSALRTFCVLCTFCLLAACSPAATRLPAPTPAPSLTASPTEDIATAVSSTLTALVPVGPTATDLTLTATPNSNTTSEATPDVTLPPLAGVKTDPPLDITLPDGWTLALNDVQVLPDVIDQVRGFPVHVYTGPVTGGKGTIVLYWGFPNLNLLGPDAIAGMAGGTPLAPDIWSDGLRLLNLAVVEQGCTVGTDLKRTYRVGLLSGTGTQFSAVKCPQLPDTRGWFVGVREKGLNFVFYVYVEGDEVMSNQNLDAFHAASDELQAILDTVRFRVPDVTATPSP